MTTNPYESPEQRSDLVEKAGDWIGSAVRIVGLLGLLGLLLLFFMPRWPIGGARESARRMQCGNNLRNIALALQNYESAYHCLPPAYTVDASGKRLHSWRTLILPFIEQKALYDRIDLTKPWDDPANELVHKTVVRLYECPSSPADRFMTTYFAVVAPGGCFQGTESTSLAEVKDRREATLLVIEVAAKHAVHWMSPMDATEEMIVNRQADGGFSHRRVSQAAFVDGHVESLADNVRADVLRALISIEGKDDDVAADR